MKNLLSLLFICLLASFAGAALAQTPDGEPPSLEQVCDLPWINGAAFGLCNAYCEAMDCHCPRDSADPDDCVPSASQRACDRVRERFAQWTGEDVPCECGDGELDEGEECDDGNNEDGDGCSATCELEVVEPDCPCTVVANWAGVGADDSGGGVIDPTNGIGTAYIWPQFTSTPAVIATTTFFNSGNFYSNNGAGGPDGGALTVTVGLLTDLDADVCAVFVGGNITAPADFTLPIASTERQACVDLLTDQQ